MCIDSVSHIYFAVPYLQYVYISVFVCPINYVYIMFTISSKRMVLNLDLLVIVPSRQYTYTLLGSIAFGFLQDYRTI